LWYGTKFVPGGYTVHYNIKAMHSDASTYGEGGLGGPRYTFTAPSSGSYTFYFDDNSDMASVGADLTTSPGWLEVDLQPGDAMTRQLVLKNSGALDLKRC
jgi:hypothetical protein